ncbi:unnamed protein product [Trichobilharzia szidati]|nr:unnamed protein product [Trichobilharzia szidati]
MSSPTKSKSPPKSKKSNRSISPKKSGRSSPKEYKKDDQLKVFSRQLYDTIHAIYKKKTENLILYLTHMHIYEVWNKLPIYEQYCNSNIDSNNRKHTGSPRSKSPKNRSPKSKGKSALKPANDDKSQVEYLPAILEGTIAFNTSKFPRNSKIVVEITATFRYMVNSRSPVFHDSTCAEHVCYRDFKTIYPLHLVSDRAMSECTQELAFKLRQKLGRGYRVLPFQFELSNCPDSILFNDPNVHHFSNGLSWKIQVIVAPDYACLPLNKNEISMNFYKYTITPLLSQQSFHESPTVECTRFATNKEIGNLTLRAKLDRDIYYHGQFINVKIEIENQSEKYIVNKICIYIEQTCRIYHQFPHDSVVQLNELVLDSTNSKLPILPKTKLWVNEVKLCPHFNRTKANLAIDGKLPADSKAFLASSTIITFNRWIPLLTETESTTVAEGGEGTKTVKQKSGSIDSTSPKKASSAEEENKSSPRQKSPSKKPNKSPKEKHSSSPKRSKKKHSPSKSPAVQEAGQERQEQQQQQEGDEQKQRTQKFIKETSLTSRQICRSIFISYDLVVRLNLNSSAGNPTVRVPFILTRESQYIDKMSAITTGPSNVIRQSN